MRPRAQFLALIVFTLTVATLWPASARAQYPWYPYPYPYGVGVYRGGYPADSSVRVIVTPKQAEVYVDGYYAGIVDDFDGFFQRLHVPLGEHEITLYREGFKTVHQKIYLTPASTYKLRYTMEKLGAGETAEPRPVAAAAPPAPPDDLYPPQPRMGSRRMPPQRFPPQAIPPQQEPPAPAGQPADGSRFGTLVIRVQPADADVMIDGEHWRGPQADERLVVQVSDGPHRVEIHKDGYRMFSTQVQVRRGESAPLNVSLTPDRQ